MIRKIVLSAMALLCSVGSLPVLGQSTDSKPGSEGRYVAGESFQVKGLLLTPFTDSLSISVTFDAEHPIGETGAFGCSGLTAANTTSFVVLCQPSRTNQGGVYRVTKPLTLMRPDTQERLEVPGVRFPIITLIANPLPPLVAPKVVGTVLLFSTKQALAEGSRVSGDILDALSEHLPTGRSNSKEARAYLRSLIRQEIDNVNTTRDRYMANVDQRTTNPPVAFEDFDRRLDAILRRIDASNRTSAAAQSPAAHLVFAQMPSTSDSVTVPAGDSGSIDEDVSALVGILRDAEKGFLLMAEAASFTWSLSTTPAGAEVFVSRLDEPETKWAGVTNLENQHLDYSRWIFRISWNGCSKTSSPDPFLQPSPLRMVEVEKGCVRR